MTAAAEPYVERCERCDLPLYSCEHGAGTPPPAFPYRPTIPARPTRPWVPFSETDEYRSQWRSANHERRLSVIVCDDAHPKAPGAPLCRSCADLFRACLADVGALTHDLALAQAKLTAFAQRGTRYGDAPEADESPLPYNPHASEALHRLGVALGLGERLNPVDVIERAAEHLESWPSVLADPQLGQLAAAVSGAVLHGFRVVDRPPDVWFYGECPACHRDIYGDRDVDVVSCSSCAYQATRAQHQRACLDAGDDRMLTVSELVGAITSGGETVTRDQINGYIRRQGLPRERMTRPVWRDGVLVPVEVYVYRLGDVRELAAQAEARRFGR